MSQHSVSAAKQDYLMSKAQDTCIASYAREKASSMEDSLWLRHQAKSNLVVRATKEGKRERGNARGNQDSINFTLEGALMGNEEGFFLQSLGSCAVN